MKKFETTSIVLMVLLAVVLFLFSSFASRQTTAVPLPPGIYKGEHYAGGAMFVTIAQGFPLNFINNPNAKVDYIVDWPRLLFDFLFWMVVSVVIIKTPTWIRHENTRN